MKRKQPPQRPIAPEIVTYMEGTEPKMSKQSNDRLLRQYKRFQKQIEYWSYCMYLGMKQSCPEKREELRGFLDDYGVFCRYVTGDESET